MKEAMQTQTKMQTSANKPLEFTGNWFIDAGILGFVNLMEEVYENVFKKDENFLEFLQNIVAKTSPKDIEKLFVYAFWYKTIKDTTLRWLQKDNFKKKILKEQYKLQPEELLKSIEKEVINQIKEWHLKTAPTVIKNDVYSLIIEFNNFLKKTLKKLYKPYENALRKIYASNKKTIVENLENIGLIAYNTFFTNLGFFNPASNKYGKEEKVLSQFETFLSDYFIRKDKKIKSLPTDLFDKALSPFIYSASDFNNQLYGKPFTLRKIEEIFGINPVYYLLSFPFAFVWIGGKYYMFYSPRVNFTYKVNRELKYLSYLRDESQETTGRTIFEITWDIILDKIHEYKATYFLENMYIVEYTDIVNQQIQNVEYIGISKFQASLIIDDSIRKFLNKNIPSPKKDENNKTIWIWLLKEFIKNKSLLPHVVNYVHGIISDNWRGKERNIGKYTLLTSLAIDVEVKIREERIYRKKLFSIDFFSNYENIVNAIKNIISTMSHASKLAKNLIEKDDRDKLATCLFRKIKGINKYGFVNEILRYLVGVDGKDENKKILVKYLFDNILNNDSSWENYALALVIGLVEGGRENE